MKSGDVNMEIPQRHPMLSDRKKAIGGANGNSGETIHLEPASDDDSGTDEPQPISLKKAVIVPLKTVKELNNNNGHVRARRDSGTSVLALCNNNRDNGKTIIGMMVMNLPVHRARRAASPPHLLLERTPMPRWAAKAKSLVG